MERSDAKRDRMQLLDGGIGLFERDLGKCAGPLFVAVLEFLAVSSNGQELTRHPCVSGCLQT